MPANSSSSALSSLLPAFSPGTHVPKTIYQVFYTKDVPAAIGENIAKIRALNPHWAYHLYDDEDMIGIVKELYGQPMLDYYLRINPRYGAARADLFRYLLIYAKGGVYLDIKGSLDKRLDEVLRPDDVYLLARWRNGKGEQYEGWGTHQKLGKIGGHELQQWHIVAAPGHPFLRAVIERVLHNIDHYNPITGDTGKTGVLAMTGPIAYTLAITSIMNRHPHRFVDAQEEIGLRYSIFASTSTAHRAHKHVFKQHYTELNEPVAELSGAVKFAWTLYSPIYQHVVLRMRQLIEAIARRLPYSRAYRG
jgi:hypothetical protein